MDGAGDGGGDTSDLMSESIVQQDGESPDSAAATLDSMGYNTDGDVETDGMDYDSSGGWTSTLKPDLLRIVLVISVLFALIRFLIIVFG